MQFFGKAKKAAPTAKDSIMKLREAMETLEKVSDLTNLCGIHYSLLI